MSSRVISVLSLMLLSIKYTSYTGNYSNQSAENEISVQFNG